MPKLVVLFGALALLFIPAGGAQAPSIFHLHVNDTAVLAAANVRCVAKQPALLMCGGGTSRIFVQFTRNDVHVFRAVGPFANFKRLYRVRR